MSHYPPSLLNLIKQFSKLPGIGEKTATRLALHILRASEKEANDLSLSINEVKEKVHFCPTCFGLTDEEVCNTCKNPMRDPSLVCVVEQTDDMASIERSGAFNGLYHVLHGTLSPMNGIGPDEIRFQELLNRVKHGNIKEIVIATGTSVEGESTASFILQHLSKYPVKISRIASGVPVGGDLKFVDQITMKCAIERRHLL